MTTKLQVSVKKDREVLLHRATIRLLIKDMSLILLVQLAAVFYIRFDGSDTNPMLLASLCIASGLISLLVTFGSYYTQRRIKARRNSICHSIQDADAVPLPAEFLLQLFLPKKDREEILGDLTEEYPKNVAKFGERWARVWLCKQILTSLWPMLQTTGRTLVKWGLIGWLEEVIRRIAH